MKKWHTAALCAVFACTCAGPVLAADTETAAAVPQEVQIQQQEATADENIVITDPAVNIKNAGKYYLSEGKAYEQATGMVESIDRNKTELPADRSSYYYRVEKNLTGNYFYSVKAYATDSHVLLQSYFVAKDSSCVWRLKGHDDADLIFGTADQMLEKAEVVVYPKKISLGSYGILRVRMPGRLPYDVKITSLNPSVADISDKLSIVPKEEGKADLVIDLRIGNSTRTLTKQIKVIDTADKSDHGGHRPANIGVGVGIGWGGGWHHHGGGIGIWV